MNEEQLIKKYLGVSYKSGGRSLRGLDCWGLIVMVFKDFGVEVLDMESPAPEQWSFKNEDREIMDYWKKWVPVSKPQFLDVLLLNTLGGSINHAGICLSGGRFIHCTKSGVLVSRLARWKQSLSGFYRLKERMA